MQVERYDEVRQAWLVRFEGQDLEGWVPEALAEEFRISDRRMAHENVYRWLSEHAGKVERALRTLKEGGTPAAPYDQLALAER